MARDMVLPENRRAQAGLDTGKHQEKLKLLYLVESLKRIFCHDP